LRAWIKQKLIELKSVLDFASTDNIKKSQTWLTEAAKLLAAITVLGSAAIAALEGTEIINLLKKTAKPPQIQPSSQPPSQPPSQPSKSILAALQELRLKSGAALAFIGYYHLSEDTGDASIRIGPHQSAEEAQPLISHSSYPISRGESFRRYEQHGDGECVLLIAEQLPAGDRLRSNLQKTLTQAHYSCPLVWRNGAIAFVAIEYDLAGKVPPEPELRRHLQEATIELLPLLNENEINS
jgi:hypothetical protein